MVLKQKLCFLILVKNNFEPLVAIPDGENLEYVNETK